jgi:release factor glutamine methyltransferase
VNIKEILNRTDEFLSERGIESSRLDAEVLLADLLDIERINLYVKFDYPLKSSELEEYRERITKRAKRIPVAYIIGRKEFMSLEFDVNEDVLIPRPETENLVEEIISYCRDNELQNAQIIDIGTGSGAVAVSLAHYLPDAKVVGVDISKEAVKTARKNAEKFELEERLSIVNSDLLEGFIKRDITGIDIIVSNPPYISDSEMEELPPEVKKEPETALKAGREGLDFYKKLIPQSSQVLKDGGKIFLEIGSSQAESVKELFSDKWKDIEVIKDYADHDRIITAVYRENYEGEQQ